jgi:hypothetical protein
MLYVCTYMYTAAPLQTYSTQVDFRRSLTVPMYNLLYLTSFSIVEKKYLWLDKNHLKIYWDKHDLNNLAWGGGW